MYQNKSKSLNKLVSVGTSEGARLAGAKTSLLFISA